ncbi:alpha/beta hydrolase family protein [Mucilaginibacter segetis]|uniref:S9 family peptidase n=1 Tax=Mucilaginibacter segetis TaxID=2793071 RepID=A0A934UM61_9SPHI|nr:prolyl oligopeptidase family serine peptidase [Mucilaginibacter segetis]MBK0379313.1 S9 family peptidase [Mucilaginibacter segetis]
MKYIVGIWLLLSVHIAFGQKSAIDSNTYKTWQSLDWGAKISNDGNYVLYGIKNKPVGFSTLIIRNVQNGKQWEFPKSSADNAKFTEDAKFAVFRDSSNKVEILDLKGGTSQFIDSVENYSISSHWIAFAMRNSKKLILRNLSTTKQLLFANAQKWQFSDNGKYLALVVKHQSNSAELTLVELESGHQLTIATSTSFNNLFFNKAGSKLIYLVNERNSDLKTISQFDIVKHEAQIIYAESAQDSLSVLSIKSFSDDEKGLILNLKPRIKQAFALKVKVPLTVWNYQDAKLPSQMIKEGSHTPSYLGYVLIGESKIVPLIYQNASIEFRSNTTLGEVALVSTALSNARGEENWNKLTVNRWFINALNTNKTTELKRLEGFVGGSVKLSPDGQFVLFYDPDSQNFVSYEVSTNQYRNITNGISTSWLNRNASDLPNSFLDVRGIAAWIPEENSVLLYDDYDIWKLSLKATSKPINLTNSSGKKRGIAFSIEDVGKENNIYKESDQLILNAFNVETKENGFYTSSINNFADPKKLSMGPYVYSLPGNPYVDNLAHTTIKWSNSGIYLLQRMSERESPNLFVTSDFERFQPISEIHPERNVNWLTTELHEWKSLDGRILKGILYKPENFDPNLKYPVIFQYYERKSDGLHNFNEPEELTSGCVINIPSYVSNGYLIFSPDIYYSLGDPMQGTYDAVVSAASYVSKLAFVDSTKIGIQGCSFGGVETDYLVTNTNKFSAACSASGISNFTSTAGHINDDGSAQYGFFEIGQARMVYSLWDRPDLYIKNSSIFNADKVTTPVLLMHTTKDGLCPIEDAIAFFTGLRRNNKKAWLLQYDDGDHGVWGASGEDFSIRMQQFFDHYLKDKPAPRWMLYGVDPNDPGVNSGLDLVREKDKNGRYLTPGPGLLDTTLSKPPQTN